MKEPVKNAIIALVLHIILLCAMMYWMKWNIYAVIFSNAAFGLFMCILNDHSVKKYSGYRSKIKKTILLPAVSSLLMGGAVWLVYFLLQKAFANNTVSTLFAIVVGIIVYLVVMLLLRGMDEEDLERLPRGERIIALAKKMHLIRL